MAPDVTTVTTTGNAGREERSGFNVAPSCTPVRARVAGVGCGESTVRTNNQEEEEGEVFVGSVDATSQFLGMTFQVAGVKKSLAAVSRICKAGNIVQFGEEESDCFIKNKTTGKKIMLQRKRGSHVLEIEFVKEGEKGNMEIVGRESITVDSGAEESVCPLGWGEVFGLKPVKPGQELRMINAGGDVMPHYGSRKVTFKSKGF